MKSLHRKSALCIAAIGVVLSANVHVSAAQVPARPRVARPLPAPAAAPASAARKGEAMTPIQRLTRSFERSRRAGGFYGSVMHSADRVLAGEPNASDLDRAVQEALARNPASRASLARMVADYRAIPAEVRSRAMPAELARLARSTPVTLADARRFSAATGQTSIIIQGGRTSAGRLGVGRVGSTARDQRSGAPRIDAAGARLTPEGTRVVLQGSFPGSSQIAPVYLRPAERQSLAETGFQTVDNEQVIVVLGRVGEGGSRVEATLPVAIAPGAYDVAVRVPRAGAAEPRSNWSRLELAPTAYSVRLLTIRCLDESDPETLLSGPNVTDEIVLGWAAFADAGPAMVGSTTDYEGFDDGVVANIRVHPSDEGGMFMAGGGSGQVEPGIVANRLFLVVQMDEWDHGGSAVGGSPMEAFFADVGRASLDELDVEQFLERLSQALHWSLAWRGARDFLGEAKLSFSAGELRELTNNAGRRHRGEMRFMNDDDTGSYVVEYEIRRHDPPR
ncbi:MAG TPA: hypothetical protein VF584_08120 [Longimicrobium sp.]|jgi:hypothetical protein